MVRTVIWFCYFWLYLFFVQPVYAKVCRLAKNGEQQAHDELTGRMVGRWARRLLSLAGAKVTVEGLEKLPEGPAVYVCNHLSYFDIPVILGYLGQNPKPILAKKQLASLPFIRGWMEQLHCVFIERENMRASVAALNEAAAWVAKGYSMVVFPEGTRSKTGKIAEFKAGAYKIAQKNKVPVVPLCLVGTDHIMQPGSLRIHPGKVHISVLDPICTEGFTKEEWRALAANTQALVEQEQQRILASQQTV